MKAKILIPILILVVAAGVYFVKQQEQEVPAPPPTAEASPQPQAPEPTEQPATPKATEEAQPAPEEPPPPESRPSSRPEAESPPRVAEQPPTPVPILMEVFSDHQCPACRRFYLQVARPVLADYVMKGKLQLLYHEFPLSSHQYARRAARYTRAAARLGPQAWIRVTDALYYYQPQWSATGDVDSVVAGALSEQEMTQLRSWLDEPALDAEIDRDIALGRQRKVRSTPTVFLTVDGRTERIPPGVDYPILRRYLDDLLARLQ